MEVLRLDSELKYANHCGSTLNIEELTELQLAVGLLNENEKFDSIYLWGRIRGVAKDYYIIMGIRFKERVDFPEKQFYWCYNNFFLSPLKEVSIECAEFLRTLNGYFSGQHDKILKVSESNSQIPEKSVNNGTSTYLDNDEVIRRGKLAKNITELDRLSFIVRYIENECAVVPFSAYCSTPNDEV